MKLALLSDSETSINFFPQLRKRLSVLMPELEISTSFVPFKLDLPLKAFELCDSSDLMFVYSDYDEKTSQIELVVQKLVEVELSKSKKIVKQVVESEVEEILDKTELIAVKTDMAEKWASFLQKLIQKPEAFSPEQSEEDFEEEFVDSNKKFIDVEESFSSNDDMFKKTGSEDFESVKN